MFVDALTIGSRHAQRRDGASEPPTEQPGIRRDGATVCLEDQQEGLTEGGGLERALASSSGESFLVESMARPVSARPRGTADAIAPTRPACGGSRHARAVGTEEQRGVRLVRVPLAAAATTKRGAYAAGSVMRAVEGPGGWDAVFKFAIHHRPGPRADEGSRIGGGSTFAGVELVPALVLCRSCGDVQQDDDGAE